MFAIFFFEDKKALHFDTLPADTRVTFDSSDSAGENASILGVIGGRDSGAVPSTSAKLAGSPITSRASSS